MARYWKPRALAFAAALFLAAAIAFVPRTVSSDLGASWNCTQNVFLTICRVAQQ